MRAPAILLAFLVALPPSAAFAGTGCDPSPVPPAKVAAAAETAVRVAAALERQDAPAALVARVGTDLSEHGLVYSHVGFAVRDHDAGRWSVVHLLNECGSDRSSLHVQGLVNFFADDLVNQDARIVWLQPELARRLAAHLNALPTDALHQSRYSIIARPGSRDYQNSTAWVLETFAAQRIDPALPPTRAAAYARAQAEEFRPDHIRIAYAKRVLGGLFSANAAFTDHPAGTRLSGRYPVVTVRSILDWLERRGHAVEQREWRGGQLQPSPGPA
ncbi:DUF2145 domain-containing protein [Luteimonas sp. R10]|uniref:DUF2145 domain-containing protein n=1 Tax=Luteimonas sp. R10 TaxID=3108176 RepID=UPI003093270B|nr:DUF2145 domain-containing protein [Luteimonas sp. R10]